MTPTHEETVRSSFRNQVVLFSGEDSPFAARGNPNLAWLGPIGDGTVALELACGAAHVAEELAPHVRAIVGVDLTPELLALGGARLRAAGITNVVLQEGHAEHLPFLDDSFDLVYCRASLHHFADPRAAVHEMARVCCAGGHVALSDLVVDDPEVRETFDAVHRLLDPSHVRALTDDELVALLPAGVDVSLAEPVQIRFPLDAVITEQSNRERVYELLGAEIDGGPRTGLEPAWEDGAMTVAFATRALQAVKRA